MLRYLAHLTIMMPMRSSNTIAHDETDSPVRNLTASITAPNTPPSHRDKQTRRFEDTTHRLQKSSWYDQKPVPTHTNDEGRGNGEMKRHMRWANMRERWRQAAPCVTGVTHYLCVTALPRRNVRASSLVVLGFPGERPLKTAAYACGCSPGRSASQTTCRGPWELAISLDETQVSTAQSLKPILTTCSLGHYIVDSLADRLGVRLAYEKNVDGFMGSTTVELSSMSGRDVIVTLLKPSELSSDVP